MPVLLQAARSSNYLSSGFRFVLVYLLCSSSMQLVPLLLSPVSVSK